MKDEILVLGDSHVLVFNSAHMTQAFPDHHFDVVEVPGATVSGLPNPNAVTGAKPKFDEATGSSKARKVIVMIGEVDTGFVIWYRAQKYGASVDEMTQLALGNYQQLLLELRERFDVACISTPLPTIRDGADWGEVANLRKEITATQRERTKLTLAFNSAMQVFCAGKGIAYLMLDQDSLGGDGVVKVSLLNTDPRDHHYDPKEHAGMIAPLLQPWITRAC
ncbi:SGNH/GDSL hydrolase family protein [Burkholderia sp. Bp9143]|uniref:SGNH/GDSL hydrolase family protein n=1 Tax=Burkholderia sp. Bp9143 TaxID=2184574 RepID=UPI000F59F6C9|nr:SGNH/GDSL hydrolase family protein [Burkholderia sp. Bp9143]RQR27343.1 SGNH/GDSL hydrolase family protein [Burkholderia sp. Bp9143]